MGTANFDMFMLNLVIYAQKEKKFYIYMKNKNFDLEKKYKPIPFWSWNEDLDVEETAEQRKEISENIKRRSEKT